MSELQAKYSIKPEDLKCNSLLKLEFIYCETDLLIENYEKEGLITPEISETVGNLRMAIKEAMEVFLK